MPTTLTGLQAIPQASGDLRLSWGRAGDAETVNFLVEARGDGGAWAFVGDVMATDAILKGYAPDVSARFRVSASKNGVVSTSTVPVSPYGLALDASRRLAAWASPSPCGERGPGAKRCLRTVKLARSPSLQRRRESPAEAEASATERQ